MSLIFYRKNFRSGICTVKEKVEVMEKQLFETKGEDNDTIMEDREVKTFHVKQYAFTPKDIGKEFDFVDELEMKKQYSVILHTKEEYELIKGEKNV